MSASKTGYTPPSDVTRALAVDLTAPAATYTAPGTLQVGVAVGALTPSTTDTDIASYGATGLPPGLGIDSATGAISGTPDTADANTAGATVTVTDSAGNTATVDITFPAVAKGDQTLTGFAYSPATVTYGGTAPAVTAPGGVQTTLAYSATPAAVCTVDASTGALTLAGVGACNITATAAGAANYNEATAAFTVTVQAAGTLALTLDTIAGDDTVNIAEKAAGFAITGDHRFGGGCECERQANWHMTEGESPLERRSSQSTFLREPCVGTCEGAGEASAAVRAGRVMERRKIRHLECRDSVLGRRQHRSSQYGEDRPGSTASKNSGTCVRHIPGPGRSSGRPGESSPGPRREGVRLDQR